MARKDRVETQDEDEGLRIAAPEPVDSPSEETVGEPKEKTKLDGYSDRFSGNRASVGDEVGDGEVVFISEPGNVLVSETGNMAADADPVTYYGAPDYNEDNNANDQSLKEAAIVQGVKDLSALSPEDRRALNVDHYAVQINHNMGNKTAEVTHVATIYG
jgi:hypothetical protein